MRRVHRTVRSLVGSLVRRTLGGGLSVLRRSRGGEAMLRVLRQRFPRLWLLLRRRFGPAGLVVALPIHASIRQGRWKVQEERLLARIQACVLRDK